MVESYIFIEMGIEHFHPLPIRANRRERARARGGSCSLSGPYKVLNPKFRGRSKVVKSGDPPACAPDDSLTGEEEKYNRGRRPSFMHTPNRNKFDFMNQLPFFISILPRLSALWAIGLGRQKHKQEVGSRNNAYFCLACSCMQGANFPPSEYRMGSHILAVRNWDTTKIRRGIFALLNPLSHYKYG